VGISVTTWRKEIVPTCEFPFSPNGEASKEQGWWMRHMQYQGKKKGIEDAAILINDKDGSMIIKKLPLRWVAFRVQSYEPT
jgi:hypothetical protein